MKVKNVKSEKKIVSGNGELHRILILEKTSLRR